MHILYIYNIFVCSPLSVRYSSDIELEMTAVDYYNKLYLVILSFIYYHKHHHHKCVYYIIIMGRT